MRVYISILLVILACSFNSFGQISWVVVNAETLEPIPYVNIQVENVKEGFSTDLNGRFKINEVMGDNIVFSAIGFETYKEELKWISDTVFLDPIAYPLEEVEILSEDDKELEIGDIDGPKLSYSYNNCLGSDIIANYFPFYTQYVKTPYLKEITFWFDDQKAKDPIVNIRVYSSDKVGYPSKPLIDKNLIIEVSKHRKKHTLDLQNHYIKFPKDGLFIAIEWLALDQNLFSTRSDLYGENSCYSPKVYGHTKDVGRKVFVYRLGEWLEVKSPGFNQFQIKITLTN